MENGLLNQPAFMLIVIAATALLVKAFIDYLSRRQLIAKGAEPEDMEFQGSRAKRWTLIKNLKWALICLGFGTAIIASERFPNLVSSTGSFGLMFVGAGLGFLLYFLVAWHWLKKDDTSKRQNGDNG